MIQHSILEMLAVAKTIGEEQKICTPEQLIDAVTLTMPHVRTIDGQATVPSKRVVEIWKN